MDTLISFRIRITMPKQRLTETVRQLKKVQIIQARMTMLGPRPNIK